MHNKKVFTGCMIRHGALLLAEAILALAVSVILVQGNKIISGVIDEMLSGRQVLFGSFLLQFLIYTVVGTIAAFLQSAAASRYAVEVCTEYRDLVGEKLYRTEYKYFDANYSATLLNKVIGDLGEIASFLETVLPDMIASFIGIFTYAVYIGETNLGLLAVILITYPLIFWIAGKLVKRIRGLQANYRQKTDVMAQIAQDAVSGILVLRSFGIEEVFRKKMHKASVELVENEEKRTQITNTAIVVRKLIQWLPNIISAVYAVWLVSRGVVSLGGLVGFIMILSKFVDAYTGLPFAMVDASAGMVSVDRVERILSAEEEPSGEGCADAAPRAVENVIAFEKVDFSYHENVPVLQGLTFSVKKGENVAFVGESGGGKSTIFRILCGFYEKRAENTGSLADQSRNGTGKPCGSRSRWFPRMYSCSPRPSRRTSPTASRERRKNKSWKPAKRRRFMISYRHCPKVMRRWWENGVPFSPVDRNSALPLPERS